MRPTSTAYERGLLAESFRASSVGNIEVTGSYDLVVLVSSWDQRCLNVLEMPKLKWKDAILVLFDEVDPQGFRLQNDMSLQRYLEDVSSKLFIIRGSAVDVRTVWREIAKRIGAIRARTARPLRIALDLSTSPRYLTLSILGAGLRSGVLGSLDVIYRGAEYPDLDGDDEVVFSRGAWATLPIRGLEGWIRPGRRRFFLASIGFEGWKVRRVLAQWDPQRVSILVADPGTVRSYAERALSGNREVLEEYSVPDEQIVRAPANDAVAAWEALQVAGLERGAQENVYYLLSGNKPHSLALALRAYTLRYPAVLYPVPESHHAVRVKPSGDYWIYRILSLTSPE